ncbi:Fe-S cluster assembly protein SufD [Dyadobacter sediminis]|uniref:Fe-S cluster assembly protein SufD n=1 Tax=Dyadobacter sediminis TaxID=1493691 RepID=A0A5R9KF41_9BACT|nr:Fe-S cluster assembly protein SufD [Dyadobacter sediminis]TLU94729.1 Fe-S cluster assembly protein SufD [Dyadobacter sediminis]GGB88660.1 Fe-S cluster assembly protein SufD [Dyadobacter sediminis]
MSNETIDLKTRLVTDFYARESVMNGEASSAFHQKKRAALAEFDQLGFPTTRNEEWKYSNVKDLTSVLYNFNAGSSITTADLEDLRIPSQEANILYFINGHYNADLSVLVSAASQIIIDSLQEAYKKDPVLVNTYFNELVEDEKDAFTALNTAFAHDGVFIHIPDNQTVEHPVILRFISDARIQNVGSQPRNIIAVGRNAHVKVAEAYRTLGNERSFTNTVTEIFVSEDAGVEYYKVQNESENAYHIGTTKVKMLDRSQFYSGTVTLNGRFTRNNLNIILDGERCEAHMYGLYFPDGTQHVDNHTVADHRKPNSESNELYKGILRDRSKGVFNGKIFVRPDAQKTNAFQSCKNIVLSTDATMNTKPQLEIFADDVKCSHGTTTGQIDEEALFYMRSRGISQSEAMALLMFAFCADVISQIRIDSIREYLEGVIAEKLASK